MKVLSILSTVVASTLVVAFLICRRSSWEDNPISANTVGTIDDSAYIPSMEIGIDVFNQPVNMPLVGAGTWQYDEEEAYESVCKAFAENYTMVDTAYGYRNQRGVGRAIRDCWRGRREDLFIMTKIPGGLSTDEVWDLHFENLAELNLTYVDHLMTHFPADWDVTPDRASAERRQEGWKALEGIYHLGMARSIGISHYCVQHIDDILEVATVTPSINQVEYHVGSGDVDDVIEKCRENGITFMSFSPLCGPCTYDQQDSLIRGRLVTAIGNRYGVSGSQVALRFIVQQALEGQGIGGVIPKSNNADHIRANRQLFHFTLSDEDMAHLRAATKPAAEGGDCDVP